MKALKALVVGGFNQERALVGAFSVIVKTGCGTDGATTQHYLAALQYLFAQHFSSGYARNCMEYGMFAWLDGWREDVS